MRTLTKIAFWISEVADRKAEKGKYWFAARLYRLATAVVKHDVSLMRELLKRIEETK